MYSVYGSVVSYILGCDRPDRPDVAVCHTYH